MIKAIIWDMDGVLIDSEPYHIKAEIKTLKHFGVDLSQQIAEKYFGLRTIDYFQALSRHYQVKLPILKMLTKHQENLGQYYREIIPPMPHAQATLKKLQPKYLQGLATSTIRALAATALKRLSLFSYFQTRVFGDQIKHGKPHPEIFLTSAAELQVSASSIIVIEDSSNGLLAAKTAGMTTIAYRSHHNQKEDLSLASHLVNDLRKIPTILSRL